MSSDAAAGAQPDHPRCELSCYIVGAVDSRNVPMSRDIALALTLGEAVGGTGAVGEAAKVSSALFAGCTHAARWRDKSSTKNTMIPSLSL